MEAVKELLSSIYGFVISLGQTIRVWDIIDILVIAYLIYYILMVMRKTNAGSVIKGIIFVLVVAWLSYQLKLKVITYILRQTLEMGVLVLIVLFQPELRRMFSQMGTSRFNFIFWKRAKNENTEEVIQSVVTASALMAQSKTGALIVFERNVGLNDYAVSGTKIDALITAELVQNIFYHNSPLHDGALFIRDGRILAAACMLPLTNNANLGRDVGMRHKAGVGISERSDCVAVIVSEQTGTISVAVDGMLKRHLTKDTLTKLLRSELIPGENVKDSKEKSGKVKDQ